MAEQSEGIHLISRMNTKIPIKARGWNGMNEEEED